MTTDPARDPASLGDRIDVLLRELAGPNATLHPGQGEAIRALVEERRRVLCVQRTGWGKSAVYFIATRLLRDEGAGPTLLVSPLLALMRDQIRAAEAIGIRAATVNSTNRDDWEEINAAVLSGGVDLLLISPERLNNVRFRREVLPELASGSACSSSTRRIASPTGATTFGPTTAGWATCSRASDRESQCSRRPRPRTCGSRPTWPSSWAQNRWCCAARSIARRCISASHPCRSGLGDWPGSREHIPQFNGSGIVYCLTIGDTERVAEWLCLRGIDAAAYSGRTEPGERERIEAALRRERAQGRRGDHGPVDGIRQA